MDKEKENEVESLTAERDTLSKEKEALAKKLETLEKEKYTLGVRSLLSRCVNNLKSWKSSEGKTLAPAVIKKFTDLVELNLTGEDKLFASKIKEMYAAEGMPEEVKQAAEEAATTDGKDPVLNLLNSLYLLLTEFLNTPLVPEQKTETVVASKKVPEPRDNELTRDEWLKRERDKIMKDEPERLVDRYSRPITNIAAKNSKAYDIAIERYEAFSKEGGEE